MEKKDNAHRDHSVPRAPPPPPATLPASLRSSALAKPSRSDANFAARRGGAAATATAAAARVRLRLEPSLPLPLLLPLPLPLLLRK